MTTAEFDAVLTQVASIAAECGWTTVDDFVSGLASTSDILLLEADGVNVGPLADWIAATSPGATVTIASLEGVDDPGASLWASRIVVAFQCGQFLTPGGIDVAQQILLRPSLSRVIVFVGAEVIHDPDDLRLVERGIWQALAGEPGVRWTNQDLAEHGCLLWSQRQSAESVADRLGRDRALLERWLRAPLSDQDALASLRADYVLQLAEREVTLAADPPLAREARDDDTRLRNTRKSLEDRKPRLLKRLDGDATSLDNEITSSLDLLRMRLVRNILDRIGRRGTGPWSEDELRREVEGVIRRGMDDWRAEISAAMESRWGRTTDAAAGLLGDIDWELVNSVAAADRRYPDVILGRIRALAGVAPAIDKVQPSAGSPPLLGSDPRATVLRVASSGVALAVVAALVAGPAIVPVAAAGAAGVVGGRLVDRHLGNQSNHRTAGIRAKADVGRAVNYALDAARQQVRDAVGSARGAVVADFRSLDDALHTAVLRKAGQSAVQSPSGMDGTGSVGARVAELRCRLDSALAAERT